MISNSSTNSSSTPAGATPPVPKLLTVDGKSYNVSCAGLGAGGDMGADGKGNWRVKNSYADFNMGPRVNAKVGIQDVVHCPWLHLR